MSKARDLADFVAASGQLADGVISVSEISDLTATAAELNTLDGITATVTELNYMDGATSSIQTQLDNISVTSGSLTKTFTNGEQASITLSGAISPAPVVSVTKEVAQAGISSKGAWDVATDGANYELHNTAYDTTLTPGTVLEEANNWTYDSVDFSVQAQDTSVQDVAFNNDGTKLFILGKAGDDVNEYALSTAYDITTASYTRNFSIASQDTTPTGFAFNPTGTKLFLSGFATKRIYEYSLSTGFDLSTASYTSNSFNLLSPLIDDEPHGLAFINSGAKLILVGKQLNKLYQFSMSTAYDLSTLSYDSVSFSVNAQATAPRGIAFNANGTKFFVLDLTAKSVFQYSMSTAYDITTASYDSVSKSVSAVQDIPAGFTFNGNFTKMFVVGNSENTVDQYSVGSEALLLGSGSFSSTDVGKRIVGNGGEAILTATDGSYSVVTAFNDSSTIASGSWSMYALTFDNTDGVTLSNSVNGFDLSVASYDSVSFSVAGQETVPNGVAFNNDGTKMYIVGLNGDDVNEYSLSTTFDVSTATYTTNFSVAGQDTAPADIVFNTDGTKMFIVGDTSNNVSEYALSTAFDVSTATFTTNFSVTTEESSPSAIAFNSDGTKMYILGFNGDDINQYTLSTAFDLSTASFDSVTFSVSGQELTPRGLAISNDGLSLFIVGNTNNTVFKYTLSTAFDISTASYASVNFSVASQEIAVQGITFNNDGTKMYIVGFDSDTVYQYSTGTTYAPTLAYHPTVTKNSGQIDTAYWTDINTMTADETLNGGEVYYAVSTDNRTTWAVIDDTDGVRPIVRNNAGTWQYNNASTYSGTTWVNATTNEELYALQEALEDGNAVESIGFQLSSASYDSVSFSVASQETQPTDLTFNNDGTKMFVCGADDVSVHEYSLSTAFDISTASFTTSKGVGNEESSPRAVAFNSDGTKMFICGSSGDEVNQYSLSTGFDLSTASFDSVTFSVASQDTSPVGMTFNSDGTKMYVIGFVNTAVFQYSLSTANDLSTASYDSVSFSLSSQMTAPQEIVFNTDGTKMFVVGNSNDDVYQYTLSTAFDISTASYDSVSFDISSQEATATGLAFNANGTKMYIVGSSNDTVYQYSTGTTNNFNRMNSTQLDAVTDPNHYTLGDTLDLAIMLYTASAGSIPESDGVSINYDAEALNQGAVVGTDYDFDFPDSTTVRITSNAAQNLKVRVV